MVVFCHQQLLSRLADWFCPDRSAAWDNMKASLCGTLDAKKSLLYGTPELAEQVRYAKWYFHPTPPGGMLGIHPKHGFSGVFVPGRWRIVTYYSCKLYL